MYNTQQVEYVEWSGKYTALGAWLIVWKCIYTRSWNSIFLEGRNSPSQHLVFNLLIMNIIMHEELIVLDNTKLSKSNAANNFNWYQNHVIINIVKVQWAT